MNRFLLGLAVAALAFAPGLGDAADPGFAVRNAGDLAALCTAKPPDAQAVSKHNFCHGFAQGVFSSEVERARAGGAGAQRRFCMPNPAPTRAATLTEFAKWLDANPAGKADPPAETLLKFLAQRFPCPRT
jgi:hypothetical protein